MQYFIRVIRTHKTSPGKGQNPNSQSKHKNINKKAANQNFRFWTLWQTLTNRVYIHIDTNTVKGTGMCNDQWVTEQDDGKCSMSGGRGPLVVTQGNTNQTLWPVDCFALSFQWNQITPLKNSYVMSLLAMPSVLFFWGVCVSLF